MVMLRRTLSGVAVLIALTVHLTALSQKPTAPSLDALRKAAGDYVDKYVARASGVSVEEFLMLTETSGGQTRVPLRIASDVVFVALGGQLIGLRDPYAIDTRKLRDHQPRVVQALSDPTPANWTLTQEYVRSNMIQLRHNVVVWYSDPAMALQFIATANQGQLTYKLEGDKKMNGVQVFGVGFKEATDGPRLLDKIPGNAQSSGRFWVDPATGAIHMTELWVQSQTDVVRARVTFAPDAKLGLLVPKSASGSFEWREYGSNYTNPVGAAPMKLSFESNADYSNAKYSPIDLSRGGK